jgi:predicted flap endonuclease-1-like 5' DNA nuclease
MKLAKSIFNFLVEGSKVKPWINEDIFKTWTDAQKRLWESLCAAVPFQPPAGVETWRETYIKNLTTWEAAVKKTLTQEATWVQQWVHQIAQEKGTPEMMGAWIHQMEDVLQRWIQTQHQWWDDYFAVLRQGESVAAAEFASTQPAPATAPEPVIVVEPEPVAVVEPEPVAVVEPEPVAVVEPEPVAVVEPEPVAVVKPEPVAVVEPEPVAVVEPEPVVVVEPEPVAVVEPEPVAVVEPEPVVVVEPEPVAIVEPEPAIAEPVIAAAAPKPSQPDDLKLISGIGPALEKKLRKQGISSYRQLAALNDMDIARIEASIKFAGRIRRDNWIGQAKTLHFQKYQEQL